MIMLQNNSKTSDNSNQIADIFPLLAAKSRDNRTRTYLVPKAVVAFHPGKVTGQEFLLQEGYEQIGLYAPDYCILNNDSSDDNAYIVLDFGIEIHGSVRIYVKSCTGRKTPVRVRMGESLMEAMSTEGEKGSCSDHANRDMVINASNHSSNETNQTGFRFVRIDLIEKNTQISLKKVSGVFIYRDLPYLGSFDSSDSLLNDIWKTAAYTVHLNMQDYLWDGIKRDRLIWIGDMHTEVKTIQSVFGVQDIVNESMDFSRNETPLPNWINEISSYSLWWIIILYDWYWYTGNINWLKNQECYLSGLITNLAKYVDENGKEFLSGRRFLDWPTNDDPVAIHAGLQSLMLMAVSKGGYLLKVLKNENLSRQCKFLENKLKMHTPEANHSKQASAFLALSGLKNPEKINDEILAPGGASGYSCFMGYYILSSKSLSGNHMQALNDIRSYWGGMLKMGATSFWEDFSLDWMDGSCRIDEICPPGKKDIHGDFGNYCYKGFRHSLCHGWSSGPVPWLSENVLGVSINQPGCISCTIKPFLGDLDWVSGRYPVPSGVIEISHEKFSDGRIHTEFTAPAGVDIKIDNT